MKNINKCIRKITISIFILFYILLSTFFYSNLLENSSAPKKPYEINAKLFDLKISGQEINITTPENKTYTEPLSGYYPATYGFENDNTGDDPYGWTIVEDPSCFGDVVSDFSGHNKVLRLRDNNGGGGQNVHATYTYENSTYGYIEMWISSSDVTDRLMIEMMDYDGGTYAFRLELDNGNWIHLASTIQKASGGDIDSPVNNQWYHVRIAFESTFGGFEGLLQYEWKVWIDGIESVAIVFDNNFDELGVTHYWTSGVDLNYDTYIDALGYSWDPNYNIGDNLKEGLLVSFENSISLDWIGYSLDGLPNRTILGNTTVPFPTVDGVHTIQLFGNSSIGTMYQSNLRYFSTKIFIIETPENKTYTQPMSGYYPATYGFENDNTGDDPYGWTIVEDPSCFGDVVSDFSGHNKVLRLRDNNGGGGQNVHATYTYENSTYGYIEMWISSSDVTDRLMIEMMDYDGGTYAFRLELDNGNWIHLASTIQKASGGDIDSPVNNQWYHVRIAFESTFGGFEGLLQYEWKVWIDGIESVAIVFDNNFDELGVTHYWTSGVDLNYDTYIDALGYSWDPNYNIGDNLKEGLLVSFENSISLDWIGYSLDGLPNRTILGNTTINLPSDGLHTIQMFGNDSLGTMYQSEISYFEIDTSPPIITINNPEHFQFFGVISPQLFNISIEESNLISMWYSVDNGITNITITELTGTINQTEWNKLGNGTVTFNFYAADSGGYIGHNEIKTRKDINNPTSTLYFIPHSGTNIVNESTTFSINVDDGLGSGVSIIRYKINDSGLNDYLGPFTLSSYAYGYYNISYYAIDVVGNIEEEKSTIVQLVEIPPEIPPGIPGYSLLILVSVLGLVSIIVIKKRVKSLH